MAMTPDERAIAELHERWMRAEREGRTADLLEMCCDEVVIAPPDQAPILGVRQVKAYLLQAAAPIDDLIIADLSIQVFSGMAIKQARFATRLAGTKQYFRGRHLWVLRPSWTVTYITWAMEA